MALIGKGKCMTNEIKNDLTFQRRYFYYNDHHYYC